MLICHIFCHIIGILESEDNTVDNSEHMILQCVTERDKLIQEMK